MPKITAPFREKKEVESLIEAGADELYCGYLSPAWVNRYTDLEFERKGSASNFNDLEELREAVGAAHKRNIPVFLTVNGLYVNSQYPLLLKIVKQLEEVDFDAFIVADLGLLLTLRKIGTRKEIHISTGGTAFNSKAVDFYRGLGASRIILDRQITIEAMKALSGSHPDIDFEAFILNTLCVFIDGFCTFLHSYGGNTAGGIIQKRRKKDERLQIITAYDPEVQSDACRLKFSVQAVNPKSDKIINTRYIRPAFYKQLVDCAECGACALYDIARMRVKSVKIVGRQGSPEFRLKSTKFIRSALDILGESENIKRQEFIHQVQGLYRRTFKYKNRCIGNNCYHPEVLRVRTGAVHK